MTVAYFYKMFFALGIVISLGFMSSAENEVQNRSKYKYGYVIAHNGGSTQAHLESRDGDLALGRYYVNLQNGTGQKVTYFADDLGFHTGVFYSSQNGKGYSKTQIALGEKALAAFGNSEVPENTAVTATSPTLLFGKKILEAAINAVTPKTEAYPKLNYTPVPGGFFLSHDAGETFSGTTEHPRYVAGSTSQAFPSNEGKYSEGVSLSKANTQTFYPTSENVKNEIKKLQIQSTTPSIKSYNSAPQRGFVHSGARDGTTQFSQNDQTVKVSTYATNFDDVSYSNQKSIEKTNFADIDAQIISEVQKHAEQIIMKDLQKSQNVNSNTGFSRFSSGPFRLSTVTMQPIVVTNDGETGFKHAISTTAVPGVRKLSKNLQSGTINSVKITEKNSDQTLENSGYFRVSLSSSLASSINVSQTPHQSIVAESTDLNSISNNSTLCEFNLCDKDDTKQTFPIDLADVKPEKKIENSTSSESDISDGSGTNKFVQTYYPENKLHDEKHFITTIDVQKAISFDVNQNEAGTIQMAQNFPFNKIRPFDQIQNQYSAVTTPRPLVPNQISVTPGLFAPKSNLNLLGTPQEPYVLNTVAAAHGLFDVKPNQNSPVSQELDDVSSGQIQDRVGSNRLGYENQLVVPPPPVVITNEPPNEFSQKQKDDLKQVEKNIQELRQEILSSIDAQHEEEQRKQNLVDEERKQYFENLKKVEALKGQNSVSYNAPVKAQANVIQATASPISSAGGVNNVELIPQDDYVSTPQIQYEAVPQSEQETVSRSQYEVAPQAQYEQTTRTHYESAPQSQYDQTLPTQYTPQPQTYQTEIKDFTHEIAVPQPSIQQISNLETYRKQILQYNIQDVQTTNGARQYRLYDTPNLYAVDNNLQQSAPTYTTEKIQLDNYGPQITSVPFQPRYAVPQVTQTEDKSEKVQQVAVLNRQINSLPVSLAKEMIPHSKAPEAKALLVNHVVPFDYSRFLQVKQPLSLLQTYQVPLASETKLTVSEIYPVPQQVAFPVQISQAYKFVTYPDISPVPDKQYHSTLIQRPTNKLRVQPLKPSSPDEDSQREAVQNLLSQPQFHQTYYYPGLPLNNRLQLRHVRKNQISNSDQVRSQSVIRRGKSLKNLRIEYGFKPPLRPSVEFSEEVKPSIYGPSIPPQ